MQNFGDLEILLQRCQDYVVTCHENPDGDALGAANAMAMALEKMEKNVTLLYPEEIPRKYYFLPRATNWHDLNKTEEAESYKCDVLIVLDASTQKRIEKVLDKVNFNTMLNIDHHPTNTLFGELNIVDEKASSTCELLYDIFQRLELPLNKNIATNLYTGIFTDTGSFNFENTTGKTFAAAKKLVEFNISPHIIAQEIYENVPLNLFYFIREILQNLNLSQDKKIAWITCPRSIINKYQVNDSELEGVINYAKMLQPVEFAVLFRETEEGYTKVAFRSKTRDVSKVAVNLGGGGHVRAAGCFLKKDLRSAIDTVIYQLEQELSPCGDHNNDVNPTETANG